VHPAGPVATVVFGPAEGAAALLAGAWVTRLAFAHAAVSTSDIGDSRLHPIRLGHHYCHRLLGRHCFDCHRSTNPEGCSPSTCRPP